MLNRRSDTTDSRFGGDSRAEYRAAGAPYGDDDQSFCRWLLAKPRLTPSA
jgi:hypothetical protein